MEAPWIEPIVTTIHASVGTVRALKINLGAVPRGAVVLACTRGGLHSYAGSLMNRFAEHGYESIAFDVGGTNGPRSDDVLAEQLIGAIDQHALRGWSSEQIGIVGYGEVGGRAALVTAARSGVGAAVSVSEALGVDARTDLPSGHEFAGTVQAPWLGLFGTDRSSRLNRLDELKASLAMCSRVFTDVVVYPGVGAALYLDSGAPDAHAAAFDVWQRTIEWLNLRVVPRMTPLAVAWQSHSLASDR
jgi:carboxymethylenebutenolidase